MRVFGDDLIPDEISAALGSAPTKSEGRGEVLRTPNGTERGVAKRGCWCLHAGDAAPEDTHGQVRELLTKLTSDMNVGRAISQRFDVDLFSGWLMSQTNDGAELTSETLLALGERGVALSLDIYAPTSDE